MILPLIANIIVHVAITLASASMSRGCPVRSVGATFALDARRLRTTTYVQVCDSPHNPPPIGWLSSQCNRLALCARRCGRAMFCGPVDNTEVLSVRTGLWPGLPNCVVCGLLLSCVQDRAYDQVPKNNTRVRTRGSERRGTKTTSTIKLRRVWHVTGPLALLRVISSRQSMMAVKRAEGPPPPCT